MSEFELIERFFRPPLRQAVLGGGDDCALLRQHPDLHWAVSSDMLVEGRHFLSTVDPHRLGHKALAVNLSDLAACGAKPRAFTLALALPQADATWLHAFSRGLLDLATQHGCELVGGDTTRGPLNICITAMGDVPPGQALLRSGAQPGDDVWVSGCLGGARLALEVFRGALEVPAEVFSAARERMECPQPRVALGLALRGVAHAAADVSDGLLGDLGHIARASGCVARLHLPGLEACRDPALARLDADQALRFVLTGGDDYELVFTAPALRRQQVQDTAQAAGVTAHRIGEIRARHDHGPAVELVDADGRPLVLEGLRAFDHFAEPAGGTSRADAP